MAILFSNVTLSSGNKTCSFLISGTPSDVSSFNGWTNYHTFVDALAPHSQVSSIVKNYLYGAEDVVEATPEEVAYMTMRLEKRADFLDTRCSLINQTEFSFTA